MKVLVFPSDNFDLTVISEMTDEQKLDLAYSSYSDGVVWYDNERDFQEAFNNGYISDQTFIFFVESADSL